MHKILPFLFVCCIISVAGAQTSAPYARVLIHLQGCHIQDLDALGIETDHGLYVKGRSLTTDLSASELELVQQAGYLVDVLIPDVEAWYRGQRGAYDAVALRYEDCWSSAASVPGAEYPTPENYTYGSMGGYQTLDELLAVLDDMHAKYPNLISARAVTSDSIVTHEGRPQWYVRISDNPNVEEAEPKVLYTALHHAREPNSMSQMLYFMWYLLEHYDTDPMVRYIVEESELYFVPCLNPDGYVFNEINNPNGGGMWRKNRRVNADGTMGVDLNRNYGYQWGYDNNGSSPNGNSEVYRGPSAFSEPETRMLRDFTLAHGFRLALNYHTFSNLLIYPWSYSDVLAEPAFVDLATLITRENGYSMGTSIQTVGYRVNGNSDDWMYGAADVYAFTPEVGPGTFGFWPTQDTIDGLNKANMWANFATALCNLKFAEARDFDDGSFSLVRPRLGIQVQRFGIEDGPFTVSLEPLSSNVLGVSPPIVLNLAQFASVDTAFQVTFANGILSGSESVFLLKVDNGTFTKEDTLRKVLYGPSTMLFSDPMDNADHWSGTDWGISYDTYVSAPSSMTDSPTGDYTDNAFTELESETIFIPDNVLEASLRFWTKWDIEADYDYALVAAVDDGLETPLCGRFTNIGSVFQAVGNPVYDGTNPFWVEECMDLLPYAGESISIRFYMVSDGFQGGDGFYFDDLRVQCSFPGYVGQQELPDIRLHMKPAQPNPATDYVLLSWESQAGSGSASQLEVYDVFGRLVDQQAVRPEAPQQIRLQTGALPAGMYTYILRGERWQSEPGNFCIVK